MSLIFLYVAPSVRNHAFVNAKYCKHILRLLCLLASVSKDLEDRFPRCVILTENVRVYKYSGVLYDFILVPLKHDTTACTPTLSVIYIHNSFDVK
jgi:hypothetical protein